LIAEIGRSDLAIGPAFNLCKGNPDGKRSNHRRTGHRTPVPRPPREFSMRVWAVRKRAQRLRQKVGLPARPRGRPQVRKQEWLAQGISRSSWYLRRASTANSPEGPTG
jgi:hypothetical protein